MRETEVHGLAPGQDRNPAQTLCLLQAELIKVQREVPDNQLHAQWLKGLEEALVQKISEYDEFLDAGWQRPGKNSCRCFPRTAPC